MVLHQGIAGVEPAEIEVEQKLKAVGAAEVGDWRKRVGASRQIRQEYGVEAHRHSLGERRVD
jgi:hypothetical protein